MLADIFLDKEEKEKVHQKYTEEFYKPRNNPLYTFLKIINNQQFDWENIGSENIIDNWKV